MATCDACEQDEIRRGNACSDAEDAAHIRGESYECTCGPMPDCTHETPSDGRMHQILSAYDKGLREGMIVGAAIIAWADAIRQKEASRFPTWEQVLWRADRARLARRKCSECGYAFPTHGPSCHYTYPKPHADK